MPVKFMPVKFMPVKFMPVKFMPVKMPVKKGSTFSSAAHTGRGGLVQNFFGQSSHYDALNLKIFG
jgi:hypothetical protein